MDSFVSPMGHFYTVFYNSLFEAHPEARTLFKSSLKVQGKKLVMMLTTIIGLASSGDLAGLQSATSQLALRHRTFGVQLVQFHFVGECLLNTLAACLGSEFDVALKTAWLNVYCILMTFIIPAYRKSKQKGGARIAPIQLPPQVQQKASAAAAALSPEEQPQKAIGQSFTGDAATEDSMNTHEATD